MSKKDKAEEVAQEEIVNNAAEEVTENTEAPAEEVVELSVEEQLQQDLAKEKDKFLRLFAEFENYKKRTSKERMDLFKTAGQEIIVSMLPVLDDFDRAMKEISKSEDKELVTGVELIQNKFTGALKQKVYKK